LEVFEYALQLARQREDSHNRETLYFPVSYERDLYLALAENSRASVDRVVICATESVDPNAFHRAIWRDVAEMGIQSRAVYLLSHQGLMRTALAEQLAADEAAGIEVKVVVVGALPDDVAHAPIAETVILDGQVVASAPRASDLLSISAVWTLTESAEHVDESRRLIELLWQSGRDPLNLPDTLDLEEPLAESARLLDNVAAVLCRGDHVDERGCDWYHGTWQYLRLMDLVSTPSWHHDFYSSALKQELRKGARRIAITGTADYSVLAYVIDSLIEVSQAAEITVLDLCHTPLFACQWYSRRSGIEIRTVSDDIVGFASRPHHKFDILITDAFLTRFKGENLQRVLAAWNQMLEIDGSVITTVRAHSETDRGQTAEEAVLGFRDRASTRWRRWEPFIQISRNDICNRAEVYARRMISNPIGSAEAVEHFLRRSFNVSSLELASVPGELFPTKYVRAILNKRKGL
jgi:hypothetical protein